MSSGQDSDRFRSRGPSSAANGATARRKAVARWHQQRHAPGLSQFESRGRVHVDECFLDSHLTGFEVGDNFIQSVEQLDQTFSQRIFITAHDTAISQVF